MNYEHVNSEYIKNNFDINKERQTFHNKVMLMSVSMGPFEELMDRAKGFFEDFVSKNPALSGVELVCGPELGSNFVAYAKYPTGSESDDQVVTRLTDKVCFEIKTKEREEKEAEREEEEKYFEYTPKKTLIPKDIIGYSFDKMEDTEIVKLLRMREGDLIVKAFYGLNVKTVDDLSKVTRNSILQLRGIGHRTCCSILEIQDMLKDGPPYFGNSTILDFAPELSADEILKKYTQEGCPEEFKTTVTKLFKTLTDREENILRVRYGIKVDSKKDFGISPNKLVPYHCIAPIFKLTTSRIGQICQKALHKFDEYRSGKPVWY
jgi:hypothetical protein